MNEEFKEKILFEEEKKTFRKNLKLFKFFNFSKKNRISRMEFLKKYLTKPPQVKENMILLNDFDSGENIPREILVDLIKQKHNKKNIIFVICALLIVLFMFGSFFLVLAFNTNWFSNFFFKNPYFNDNDFNYNLKADSVENANIIASEFIKLNKDKISIAFSNNYITNTNKNIKIISPQIDKSIPINYTNDDYYEVAVIGKFFYSFETNEQSSETLLNIKVNDKLRDISGDAFFIHSVNKEQNFWLINDITTDNDILKYQREFFINSNASNLTQLVIDNLMYSFIGGKLPSLNYKAISTTKIINPIVNSSTNDNLFTGTFELLINGGGDNNAFLNNIDVSFNFGSENNNIMSFDISKNTTNYNSKTTLTKYGNNSNFIEYNPNIMDSEGKTSISYYEKYSANKIYNNFNGEVPTNNNQPTNIENIKFLMITGINIDFAVGGKITPVSVNLSSLKPSLSSAKSLKTDDKEIKNIPQTTIVVNIGDSNFGFIITNYTNYILKNSNDNAEYNWNVFYLLFPFEITNGKLNFANISMSFLLSIKRSFEFENYFTMAW